jgi:Tol biopolymer transport system component/tRNA A-37 threonylcarbamoyl transferase component Bud32
MPLSAGTRLGPYEIQSPAGAGGMGEVYRARDTRLDRTVAVKVLAGNLTGQPETLQRFEREARAVSTLNHPNICTLHDVGTQDGTPYLVMEYLEGETLADRLARGPLPLADAYRVAIQIGEALDQAHRKNIVHRDLKPGNVMLAGARGSTTVKLLDFGLAKLPEAQAAAAPGTLTSLPTVAQTLTAEGTIVGTFQYMSPEQLEGREADARSDIFAFGAVLFEMVTGRKAFVGSSQASLISAIMKDEPPPVSTLQPVSPPALDRLIRRCLAKDAGDRWQSVHDLVDELRWISESSSLIATAPAVVARRRWKFGAASLAAVVFALAFAALAFVHFRETAPVPHAMRFLIPPPEKTELRSFDIPVLSPDGTRIVFTVGTPQGSRLALRNLDNPSIALIPDTAGALAPFWAPDGNQIAFLTRQGVKKVDLAGGPAVTLCTSAGPNGGTWNREGIILLGSPSGILRVSAGGGTPVNVTKVDPARGENLHRWPSFLPGGRHFLFTVSSARADVRGIYAGDLDSPRIVRLTADESNSQYSPPGFLLYARGGSLTAQPFDAAHLRLTGDPFPVAENVWRYDVYTIATFSTAAGELVYATGPGVMPFQMVWFDRKGARLSNVGVIAEYSNPALSPDGRSLAVSIRDTTTKKRDIWVFDLVRGTSMRLTFDPADDLNPVWSPDGRQIIFSSDRKGARDLYRKAANGAGQEQLLLESKEDKNAEDWSRDGRFLVFNTGTARQSIWALGLTTQPLKPLPLLTGSFTMHEGRVSPDGRWLAYSSIESGRSEVYVQNFPPAGGKWQISTAGGAEPQWRADGKEMFYVQDDKTLMSVDIRSGPGQFEAGIPKPLFDAAFTPAVRNRVVISPDGQRFLVMTRAEQTTTTPFTLVLNWVAGVKR